MYTEFISVSLNRNTITPNIGFLIEGYYILTDTETS